MRNLAKQLAAADALKATKNCMIAIEVQNLPEVAAKVLAPTREHGNQKGGD